MTLSIDIETFSSVSLTECGMYRYAESPDFTILLLCYRFDKNKVRCIDLANGEQIPGEVMKALNDPTVIKKAFNAAFEITCLSVYLVMQLDPSQWICTMNKSAMCGLPQDLKSVGVVLGVVDQKIMEGKQLIRYFCIPCKPTKVNGGRTRNLPHHDIEKWERFKGYGCGDVLTEDEVAEQLEFYPVTTKERSFWVLDQKINSYGIQLDNVFIDNAMKIDGETRKRLLAEARELTGLPNPNSTAQLLNWLELAIDERVINLRKETVHELIKNCDDKIIGRILRIRQLISKSSIKKYYAAERMRGLGNRARGTLQYYGAGRTGRHAGRGIQPQNFTKNKMSDLDYVRSLVRKGDLEFLSVLYPDVPDVLSQLLRTIFIAGEGKTLIMGDFSAIEARVIAWLANEKWRLDVFKTHGKIYEASASAMFHVPIEQITKGSHWRDMGKVAELALGFQGAVGAMRRMDLDKKLPQTDAPLVTMIKQWRAASPNIVAMWYEVQATAIEAVRTGKSVKCCSGRVMFYTRGFTLLCQLPSGRCLAYHKPEIRLDEKGRDSLWYYGVDQVTHQWGMIPTYGGKLVENIVQATARDLLRDKMIDVDKAGYTIVFHVHDEIVIEVPVYRDPHIPNTLQYIKKIMSTPVSWAEGLPLAAAVYDSPYYKKD